MIWDGVGMSDDIVARVRARLEAEGRLPVEEQLSEDARRACRLAAGWERRVEHLVAQSKRDEVARNFRQRWPALVRWRDRTIANCRRARRADVAAAYELVALECYLCGVPDLAEKAQAEAMRVLMMRTDRSRQRGARSTSPAEARSA